MISHELGHFIAKFYLVGYLVCFIFSFLNKFNNKSNLIIITLAFVFCVFNQFLKVKLGFYTFYLGAALGLSVCVFLSVTFHFFTKVLHKKTTLVVYSFYISMAISYLILHRVRVVIYDSDEPISWLINAQSVFTLTLYFFSIVIFLYGCKVKWKLQFGRLLSLL
ncbi:MAG: hypothetical protein HRT53_21005 [Colwellia sp.]|nr:hypothetical protein [Colwellia sp.]